MGRGLVATAFAPHGTVEAVEMPAAAAFVLGVQWELHEEWQDHEPQPEHLACVRRTPRGHVARTRDGASASGDGHVEVTMDALDAEPVAAWWARALGFERAPGEPLRGDRPTAGDARPRLVIQQVARSRPARRRCIWTCASTNPTLEVERLIEPGRLRRLGRRRDRDGFIRWTTMTDPWGTLFCVCPARPEHRGDDPSLMSLPESARYVVIGAGVHGLSTAWHLAKELEASGRGSGDDIVVRGQDRRRARAPSGIACGVIRNNYFQPAMRELMAHSVSIWESDPEAFHYHPIGYLQIAPDVMAEDVAQIYAEQQAIGYRSDLIQGEDDCRRYMEGIFSDWQAQNVTVVLHEKQGGYAENMPSMRGPARPSPRRSACGCWRR